jgi:hypothetical protein
LRNIDRLFDDKMSLFDAVSARINVHAEASIETSAWRFRRRNNQEKGYQFEACRRYYLTKIDVLLTQLVPESTFMRSFL